ncbi:MAG: toll/interleukin-1 receptor domain-containing protein [Pseudomonas sp.]
MTNLRWDAFLSHASEDKSTVARPLANELANHRLHVWLDECEIVPGESIRAKIDEGLSKSRFGVVLISSAFLAKRWTQAELGGIFAREVSQKHVLVPVWHNVAHSELVAISPLLADRFALNTSSGLPVVASAIAKMIWKETKSYRPGMPIYAGRLSKKVLLSLPDGAYLLSNIMNDDRTPRVSQPVPAYKEREAFWAQLTNARISTSRFYVFADAAEFREHMSARTIWST